MKDAKYQELMLKEYLTADELSYLTGKGRMYFYNKKRRNPKNVGYFQWVKEVNQRGYPVKFINKTIPVWLFK